MLELGRFIESYDEFEKRVKDIPIEAKILEIGAGAYPSLETSKYKEYYLLDPDISELSKSKGNNKIFSSLEGWETEKRFDYIISHMVLEHIENPVEFHSKVFHLLNERGVAIHFFACGYSVPGLVNTILPERISDWLLRITKSRNVDTDPKYKTFYKMTALHKAKTIQFYKDLGFTIHLIKSFVGHNYLHAVKGLNKLEELFSTFIYNLGLKSMASVSLLIVKREKQVK